MPLPRLAVALSIALALAAASPLASCGGGDESEPTGPTPSGELPERGELLFVVRGPTDVSDGRISIETDLVEWFRERPSRQAGAVVADQLVERWPALGFDQDPPNAAVSGAADEVTVSLSDPRSEDGETSFAYEISEGNLSSGEQGFLSLFIDPSGVVLKFKQHKDNPT